MKKTYSWRKGFLSLILISMLTGGIGGAGQAASPTSSKPPVLLGTYVLDWLDQSTLEQDVIALDQWTGKKASLVGLLRDFEGSTAYIATQLDLLWNNGYTPFINLDFAYYSQPTAYQIATGEKDSAITAWAQVIDSWATGDKWLYIAPLPEMNTTWASYGQDPANYQLAFARIQQIFAQNGVPDSAVQWVFAPNGWAHLVFEPYYPGDSLVDVVGFSARNGGYCSGDSDLWYWNPPTTALGFSIKEFNHLAPNKPIFITGVATTAKTAYGNDTDAKNQWLLDAYNYLAVQYGVQAVIYTNYPISWECSDWPIFDYGSFAYDGYKWGVANQGYDYLTPSELAGTDQTPHWDNFTPLINKEVTGSQGHILLGMYTQKWTGLQRVIADEVMGLDNWSGKHLSIVGTFVDFTSNATDEIELQLETIRENGYTPFLNLATFNSYYTAARIAQGEADSYLREVARSFAMYAKGGKQAAYVAPLYEMNGSWPPYKGDPTNFIIAYKRIQQIFADEGVPDQSVAWVFAPNGNSAPGTPDFEYYYPGDGYVDFLGLTAYHFGYCDAIDPQYQGWITPEATIGSYLSRLIALASDKQIILAQTGTTAMTKSGWDDTAKNNWLKDMYEYLSGFSQLHAVIYFNRWDSDCDWAVFNPNGTKYDGYITGVANPAYGYLRLSNR
jgi:beta-mannanase